jgi:hypothetical protein
MFISADPSSIAVAGDRCELHLRCPRAHHVHAFSGRDPGRDTHGRSSAVPTVSRCTPRLLLSIALPCSQPAWHQLAAIP